MKFSPWRLLEICSGREKGRGIRVRVSLAGFVWMLEGGLLYIRSASVEISKSPLIYLGWVVLLLWPMRALGHGKF